MSFYIERIKLDIGSHRACVSLEFMAIPSLIWGLGWYAEKAAAQGFVEMLQISGNSGKS